MSGNGEHKPGDGGPPKPGGNTSTTSILNPRSSYPTMSMFERERERERERQRLLQAERDKARLASLNRPGESAAAAATQNRTGLGLPPHHHHHHHHHAHNHSSQNPAPGSSAASEPNKPAATSSTATNPGARSVNDMYSSRWGGGYGLFSNFGRDAEFRERELMRERERQRTLAATRERERQKELEKDRERERERNTVKPELSPTARQASADTTGPFPRPSLPPSPSVPRSLPTPNSAAQPPGNNPPSASPQGQAGKLNTPGSGRPNLPLPGFSSLGTRSLPSPFDTRERSASSTAADPAHHRTLSSSSNRPDGQSAIPQTSPGKPNVSGASASSTNRNLYGGPPPLNSMRDGERSATSDPKKSPLASPTASTKPPGSATSSTQPTGAQPTRTGLGSWNYSSPYLGFGSSFGTYGGISAHWAERERQRQREKEARDREMREAQQKRERERLERERVEREEREKQRQRLFGGGSAGSYSAYGKRTGFDPDPFRSSITAIDRASQAASAGQSRIEVLNNPSADSIGNRPGMSSYGAERDSVIQQVAPSREPRPYTYTGKNEAVPPATATQTKDRDYHYTPRDKRPRMDAAVEDQATRRGSTSKARRKKDDDKVKSPVQAHHPHIRDLSALTVEKRVWPEVTSVAVENWLKTIPDLDRLASRQLYTGSEWSLATTGATCWDNVGMKVEVRVNGGYLGQGWVIRDDEGFSTASIQPKGNPEIARYIHWEKRRLHGTDVYSDDTDLGLMLIHAGWVRWKTTDAAEEKQTRNKDKDIITLTLRVVPQLVRYTATEKNGVVSRGWGNGHDGNSIVIEAVKRDSPTPKFMNSLKNRKLRMSDMTQQRLAVLGHPEPLKEHGLRGNGVDPSFVFNSDNEPRIVYRSYDLRQYLDVPYYDEKQPWPTLWTHDLEMYKDHDVYRLYLEDTSEPPSTRVVSLDYREVKPVTPSLKRLRAEANNDENSEPAFESLASKVDDSVLSWTEEGLLVRQGDDKGLLCQVTMYRWCPRKSGSLLPKPEEEVAEEGNDGMEVDVKVSPTEERDNVAVV